MTCQCGQTKCPYGYCCVYPDSPSATCMHWSQEECAKQMSTESGGFYCTQRPGSPCPCGYKEACLPGQCCTGIQGCLDGYTRSECEKIKQLGIPGDLCPGPPSPPGPGPPSSSGPHPSPSPSGPHPSPSPSKGLPIGALIGIIVGGCIVLGIIIALMLHKKNK